MSRLTILLVLCQIFTLPILGGKTEDENPFLDLASSFLQNMGDGGNNLNGLSAIGNIVGSLMQGDNAKNLGSLLGQAGGSDGGDVLSGLGSLLGGNGGGGIDPAMVGSMISMFAQQMANNNAPKQPSRQKREESNDINLESLLSMASGFLGQGNKNAAGVLPLIMNTLSSFSNTADKAEEHKDHASFLPPILEKVHLYWDIFVNSELGKLIWAKSGLGRALKTFTGPDGKINYELMFKNFENHSFRRHWIKVATNYLTDIVVPMADPKVYQRYLATAEYMINGFLDSQDVPKRFRFEMKNPEATITVLINYMLEKYMNMDVEVSDYIFPAFEQIRQILKMAEKKTKSFTSEDRNAVADKLTDTLNLEIIEPVLRVYRAYKHSLKAPHCQEHLMCLVNRHHDKDKKGLPGFKAGLTKVSSLIASAALSFQNGRGFWDLYNAIQNDVNCEAAYPAQCSSFHEHELKVTTEVYHTEL